MKTAVCCVLGVALIGTGMARNDLCRWVCDLIGQECEIVAECSVATECEVDIECSEDAMVSAPYAFPVTASSIEVVETKASCSASVAVAEKSSCSSKAEKSSCSSTSVDIVSADPVPSPEAAPAAAMILTSAPDEAPAAVILTMTPEGACSQMNKAASACCSAEVKASCSEKKAKSCHKTEGSVAIDA